MLTTFDPSRRQFVKHAVSSTLLLGAQALWATLAGCTPNPAGALSPIRARATAGTPSRHSGVLLLSSRGDLELVTPHPAGGLAHYWRNHAEPSLPWIGPVKFGTGQVEALSMIESNLGPPGSANLELVARVGTTLVHYWREGQPPFTWHGPYQVATGVAGVPALIQGTQGGGPGHFELVVPLAGGGLGHFWRNNNGSWVWSGPNIFGGQLGQVQAVALLQSNFDTNLEIVANNGQALAHFWRDSGPFYNWSGPNPMPIPIAGNPLPVGIPGFIQSSHGNKDNFEVVCALSTGGFVALWRNNDDPSYTWNLGGHVAGAPYDGMSLMETYASSPTGEFVATAHAGETTMLYFRNNQYVWSGPYAPGTEPTSCTGGGQWEIVFTGSIVGIHAALMKTGKVLFYAYQEGSDQHHGASTVFDPVGVSEKPVALTKNVFCSGQIFLADGRLFTAGGHTADHTAGLHTFSPDTETWQYLGDMQSPRWYPTCTRLPDGRIFVFSGAFTTGVGADVNASYQFFDPVAGAQPSKPAPFVQETAPYSLYPFVYVLPNGKLFIYANQKTCYFDLATEIFEATTLQTNQTVPRIWPIAGSSVMLPLLPEEGYRPRIMLIGGGGLPEAQTTPATATCELIDLGAATPAWQSVAPMHKARVMPNAVLLPDGTVFVANGSKTGHAENALEPVYDAELYDPASDTWTLLCPSRVPRIYHSTALLLPDGRVLTAGHDGEFNPSPYNVYEHRIEIFSPPYLFKGPRPAITGAPATIGYGATFELQTPDAAGIAAVALMGMGAATHNFDAGQRHVGLAFTPGSGKLTITAPPNGNVAPPGHYMLFVLNQLGVPSVAAIVHLS